METRKCISGVKAYSGEMFKNYFYTLAFMGAKYYGADIYPFISNEFFSYQYYDEGIGFDLIPKPIRILDDDSIWNSMGIQTIHYDESDMVLWIKQAVFQNQLVIVPINRYYWNDKERNSEYYNKEHFLNIFMVYGYDDERQCFDIMTCQTSGVYGTKIGYEMLRLCFDKRVREQRRFSIFSMFGDDTEKEFAKNLELHREIYRKNFISVEKVIQDGLKEILVAREKYTSLDNGLSILRRKSEVFSYTVTLLITNRKSQTFQVETLFEKQEKLKEISNKIEGEYKMIRSLFIRSLMIQEYSQRAAAGVTLRLSNIYQYECKYLQELKNILEI